MVEARLPATCKKAQALGYDLITGTDKGLVMEGMYLTAYLHPSCTHTGSGAAAPSWLMRGRGAVGWDLMDGHDPVHPFSHPFGTPLSLSLSLLYPWEVIAMMAGARGRQAETPNHLGRQTEETQAVPWDTMASYILVPTLDGLLLPFVPTSHVPGPRNERVEKTRSRR